MDSTVPAAPPYLNLLEPPGLIARFFAHPPHGFTADVSRDGVPYFIARFDLLTTLEPAAKKRITALPLYRRWGEWLKPTTCFVGTTVTEYAPLPARVDAPALAARIKADFARRHAFLIVKDLPQDSPLLDAANNAAAKAFADACRDAGFVLLEGQALAYVAIDFASTEEYLARLSSGRRKDIRRKLRSAAALEIETVPLGDTRFADAAVRTEYYSLFLNVYNQSEIHFDLPTKDYFDAALQDGSSGGVVFVYRREGRMIGYNLCYVCGGNLVDKYVGFAYPQARETNLYFVSWMHNLDYALRHGLKHYIAGWTDPEIKRHLGARFTFTRHAVHARNPLLRAILRRFSGTFESDRATLEAKSP
ncbi:MAG: GNAT family N-acetyltransferase [Rudaea sp.]|uniref:GNAT family N-acetyltransferase n=1 Tax=Rudaea sp. TaxID=2136325 RepID=UPI0039E3DD14